MPVIMNVSRTLASLFFCQSVVAAKDQLPQLRFRSALSAEAIGLPQTSGNGDERLGISKNAQPREKTALRRNPLASLCAAFFLVISFAVAGAQTTTTALSVTPASAANGSVFAMTATVQSGATLMTGGTVTFRDTYNTQVLGTVQVQSANGTKGNAVLQRELGGIGTHSIVATYNAPTGFTTSSSTPQSITLTGLYPTVASLVQTGGGTGNYSLTTTVVGVGSTSLSPTGNVSLLDTSNSSLLLGIAGLGAGTFGQQTVVATGSPIAVGNNPQDLVVGDFNGNGLLDLAVLNSSSKTITILNGNGSGGFTAQTPTYPIGNTAVAIVSADFNGDGKLDLAVLNSGDKTVSVLLGNGDGTFNAQTTYSIPLLTTSTAIAVGDFNGDGIPDLAVSGTATTGGVVDILLGNGSGGFGAPTGIAVGNGPSSVVAGDFNGDGSLDFAVANLTDNTISVMKGSGNGTTFTAFAGSPFSTGTGTSPAAMAIADFNKDGHLDLAVAESGKNRVDIFSGKGDGTFTALSSTATGTDPVSIVVGDFNADGNPDFAVTNQSANSTSVMLGNSTGTAFTAGTSSPFTTGSGTTTPVAIATADFNGDGTSDLAVANSNKNNVGILLSQLTDTASVLITGITVPGNGTTTNHTIEASYPGDTNFAASTDTLSLRSSKTTTATLLSASTTTPAFGQQVVLTATVQPSVEGSLVAGSTVTFKDGTTTLGLAVALSSGVATLNVTSLTSGAHNITAVYAGDTNFLTSTSSILVITVGPATPVITWANPSPINYGSLLSNTQLNATSSAPGSFTYNPALYTSFAVGTYTLTATFTPTNPANFTTATASVTLVVNPATPQINWATPAPIAAGTALSGLQLDATVAVYNLVSLTPSYNVSGIYPDGTSFGTGGFDGGGNAYSENLLGTSVTWNNITYPLGPASAPDAVSNTTISLPPGHYASLNMLGALVNNATAANTFVVTYTDGTTASVTQSLSDWVFPLNYAGETNITCVPYRDTSSGGQDAHLTCVYGYQIPLDSNKIVLSVQLPPTRNVVMLAMALVSPPVPGTLVYNPTSGTVLPTGDNTLSATFTPTDQTDFTGATGSVVQLVNPANLPTLVWPTPAPITYGTALSSTQLDAVAQTTPGTTSVSISPYYRVNAFQTDGSVFSTGGFDNNGNAYSANLVGSSIVWNGETYSLGPANLPDAVTSTTIPLPQGNFVALSLIGAATTTGQTNQPFIITYTDGTTATTNFSLSPWTTSLGFPGESLVELNAYFNMGNGSRGTTTKVALYGYQIALDSTRVVQSITLPNNRNVVIVAMSLSTSTTPSAVPGTYVYTPPAGTVPAVGTIPLSVTFTATNPIFGTATQTVNLVVKKAPLTVTANNENVTFGATVPPYTDTITGFVNGDAPSVVTGAASLTTTPASPTAPGTYTITAAQGTLAATNYSFTFAPGTLTIIKATPTVTWANPAGITFGTALSGTQLNATASVPGTFTYTPAAGSIPAAGNDTLSVTFTPTNTSFNAVTQTVQIVVGQATPAITWATPSAITYGTALSALQLNATSPVVGTFVYTPAAGTVPTAGTTTLSVTFTANDSTDYAPVTKTVNLTVNQAVPVVTWTPPTAITYGTALSATQLNATASVAGTLVYTPAAGSIPTAGTDTLSVTFTPADTTDYTTITKTVQITVNKATPVITWATPTAITFGTALSATQLNATASVPGTLVYTPAAGSIPTAGTDTLSVTFTPTDTTDYTTVTQTVQLTVNKATSTVTWNNPANIVFGTALSATQLNATASVPGAFVYTPAAGNVPTVGTDTLSVTFTPTDATDFTTVTKTVQITVTQATPVITWSNPANITYGTALSVTQLNATASVAGVLVYTPAVGNIPTAGTDTLSVTFTPTDTTDYTTVTKTVQITVTQVAPVITWSNPASIVFGTALSATQLNATASVPGTLVYTPAAGSIPAAGTDTLSVTFTPTDTTSYSTVTKTVSIMVTQAAPVITWSNPASIVFGTALSATQLNATASVPGTLVYTPAAGSIPAAGTDTLSVTFTPTDTTSYSTVTKTVSITVTQAAPVITWSNPASIVFGTALSATQLNATASVPGTLVYTPAAGSIPAAGTDTLSVTFTPTDTTNYSTVTKTVQITVTQAAPVITWSNPASIVFGTALSATQLNATASVPGTLVYTPVAGSIPAAGTDTLSVTFTPTDTTSYSTVTKTVSITVTQAAPVITWSNPASIVFGTALSATQLNATASVPGTLVYTPASGSIPAAGTDTLSVTFTPTDTTSYSTVTKTVSITVTQAAPVITWSNPASIVFGTALSATQLNATASVPGTLVYTPAAGSIPAAGTDTLSVTFTPTDTTSYSTVTKTVSITVTQAAPVITWSNPASIVFGTALSATQLNATASVPGTLVYTPAAGSIPAAGTDTLSVTFTPTDTTSYSTVTKTVSITVTQAAPVITWSNPASIVFGTALSATQLNATASVPGTLVYTPAAGSIPAAGTDTLSVTFTPTDTTSYSTVTKTVQITVTQAAPVITWSNPASIVFGTALSATQLNATASVPGTLVYTPAAGSIPAAGTDTLSVTFTPTDTTSYSTVTKTVSITVTQAAPVITWSNPASIVFGTALSATQLNATASVAGTLVYTPAAGSIPAAGTDTLSVTFTPTDTTSYSTVTKTVSITVTQAAPVITWSNPASIVFGTALSATQLNATASVPGTLVYTPAAGSIPAAGTDTLSVTFTPTDTTSYSTVTKTVSITVTQAAPVITWSNPASIVFGTALSATQLNATASVPGTLVYTPAAGSIPAAGTDTLSVTFTPTDTTSYSTVTKTVSITVTQAAPVITWSNPASIVFGTALSATQLNATASVPGTLVYTPAAGSIPAAGTDTLSVTFTPTDTTSYSTVTKTVSITVTQAAPVITWSNPASIVFGTALSATQLNATASVPGTLVYTPAAGSIPAAGTDTLSVTFTPTDTTSYSTVTKTVQITVTQAAPVITWSNPASIVFGTALSATQLNATASVAGTLVYTPAAGSIPAAGTDTLSVTFTPTDTTSYSTVTKTVSITVTQAAPVITWSNPASIVFGTALSATQLNATASVPGTLVYTPAAGSIPAAGTDTLSVTFTPTDTTSYSTVTKTVSITVTQAAPVITWSNPASIVFGTALSATQLNATASVPGTLVYTPAAGSIPAAGTDTLSVTFTPTDTTSYSTVTKTVSITVTQAAPVITWSNPASIVFGTALSATQLNATASVPGTLVYTPAAGSIPAAGTDTLSVTFTPTDTTSYSTVTKTVSITVTQAAPVITWSNPASIVFGTALSATQLNATASVAGTLVYTPAAGSIPAAGTDTLSVTFTPTDTTSYSTVTKTVSITVTQAAPVITWSNPASIVFGTALSATQLNATASVPGTLVYTPAAGSIPAAGTDTLSVTFTPTDTTSYSTVTKTVSITVTQAAPVITWSNPASIVFGTALSATQLNATASVPGTLVYTPASGSIPAAGTDTLSVTFTPTDTTSYSTVTKTVSITVTQAAPVITWSNPASIVFGTALSATQLNATASVPGVLVYTPAAGSIPAAGTDTLSVTFTPTDTTSYSTVTKTVSITVTQAAPVITWSNPASIVFGTALSATQLNATASVPGTLVYTPAAGSIPAAGTDTLSVTFTPTDTTSYSTVTKTVSITVTQAAPVITWTNPASIVFGTALSATQLNATASVPGTLVYTPAAGSIPAAGTDTLSVTFTPTDTTSYSTVTKTVSITVTQAAPVITWSNPASIVFGTALSATQLNATASVPGTLVYTPAAGSIPAAGTDTLSVTFTPTDTTSYSTVTKTVQITVTQAAPVITWSNPASIVFGTALSATQLNATASVPGTLVYTPASGSIPAAGTDTLSVTFTPTDTTSYSTVTKTVSITVTQAAPVITWSNPASIVFGTALSATQLNATASVPGTLVYTPAAGSIPAAGTDTLSVTFTPTDTTSYSTVTKTVSITVTQAAPVITWSNPASIVFGTALSATQLNATASVPGTLVYTPASGSIPAAGTDTLSVTFTPTDTTSYSTVTKTVSITVTQAAPVITWSNPASIVFGTSLSATQLNATASVPGVLVYTPAAGSIPAAGTDTLSVTFTPTDTTSYSTVTKTVSITVTQAAPVITWSNPASIVFGTALSATQLNATASVPGTLVYTPAAGSIPAAGTDTLSVTFTPTDTTSYSTVTKTVSITVTQAAPVITWSNPASIVFGTALSATQLNATASVPGTLVYTPASGSIPAAGTDTLSVTFTPTDTTNYTTATKTVQITVNQATPTITWATPAAITYGTVLSSAQLDASASVAGTLVYTPAAGSLPTAGTDTLSVTFTPTDTSNYTTATKTVQLTVNQATPVITWANPASIVYGTSLSAAQLNATASVPGALVYTPAAGNIPLAGTDTLSVTFTPTDTTDYITVTKTVQLVVSQATPVITWSNPASIVYGTALSSTQLDATASVPGSFVYAPPAGTELMVGLQQLSATFTPTDLANYTTATKTVSLNVTQAVLTIEANNFTRLYGTANPTFTGNVTGTENGDTFTETFATSASTASNVGQYNIVPAVTGTDLGDYSQVVQNGTLSITKAPATTTTTLSSTTIAYGLNVTVTATVASTTSGTPTGTVNFFDNGSPLGTGTLSNGVTTFTSAALPVGTNVITAIYSGDINFLPSTAAGASGTSTVLITPLDFSIVLTSQATVEGVYGTSRQFTFHITPIGGTYPGVVQLAASPTGPILATYTFSPSTIDKAAGPMDITLTVATQKLASSETPKGWSTKVSPIALGLFLLPLLGLRYSRRSAGKLTRLISYSALLLLSLGAIGTMTGCGSGYSDHTYPITVTATSNGIQHSVNVDYHIDQSPQ